MICLTTHNKLGFASMLQERCIAYFPENVRTSHEETLISLPNSRGEPFSILGRECC
jgi:hypothetical protein